MRRIMKYLLAIFLTFAVNAFADEIQIIDADNFTVTKTIIENKSFDDVKKQIADIEAHKVKLIQERDHYIALIVEDEDQITQLQSQIDGANQKIVDAKKIEDQTNAEVVEP